MALNEKELMEAYHGLMNAFPEDLHIARPMIQMLQSRGETEAAGNLALTMARRMLSLGYSNYALAFISLCEQLGHSDSDEINSIKTMAELTASPSSQNEEEAAKVFELIEALSDAEAQSFLKQSTLIEVMQDRDIVSQGEVSRNFYLILEGTMRVHMDTEDGQHIDIVYLKKGDFFGEFACVYQLPRTATVTASSDAKVLEFQDKAIAGLMEASPLAGDSLMSVVKRRMIGSVSHAHPVFAMLEPKDREWLEDDAELLEYLEGDSFNEKGDYFFILAFGKILATRETDHAHLSCELRVNAVCGDASAKLSFPPDTKLTALERCLICKVPLEIFNAFSMAYAGFDQWVETHVAERNKQLGAD